MSEFFRQKWWAAVIVLLFVANMATLIFFWVNRAHHRHQPPPPPGVEQHDEPPPFIPQELEFTKDQQQQYARLFHEHQQHVRSLKDSIRLAKEALFALLDNNAPDQAQVKERAQNATTLQQHLDILTFRHFQQLRSICTPAQQQKFNKVIQSVVERMAPPPPPPPPPPGD